MALDPAPQPDDFPASLLVTDRQGSILYANDYFARRFGYDHNTLGSHNITDCLSGGSKIMFQSYLLPLVLNDRQCEEFNLTLVSNSGQKHAVTISARFHEADDWIYWGIFSSEQRDKLDQELVEARRLLEQKAEELHHLSITDELTGLLNRRELKNRAEQLLASSERSASPVSLLVLDIDYFKNINDELGHSTGDRVLETMGRIFHEQGRTADLVGRMGGEEFVFLLPDTGMEEAKIFAERLHNAIRNLDIDNAQVTVSIGIATDHEQPQFDALFQTADRAMYQAKDAGRNTTRTLKVV